MKKLSYFLSFVLMLTSFACNKEKEIANMHAQIRIVNNTALPLTDVIVANENFGTIAPFQTTGYHYFTNLKTYGSPRLTFYNDKTPVEYLILVCGTPPMPEPSCLQGSFTYTIVPDNTNPQGFGFSFTQD